MRCMCSSLTLPSTIYDALSTDPNWTNKGVLPPTSCWVKSSLTKGGRMCLLCPLEEVDTLNFFVFRCPIYYEIRGRFHSLFKDNLCSLSTFKYANQQCLAQSIRESTQLCRQRSSPPNTSQPSHFQPITTYFTTTNKGVLEGNIIHRTA